jgi:hypothetical protein
LLLGEGEGGGRGIREKGRRGRGGGEYLEYIF